jgi:tetratricopeptide (TPR) repeat protein
MAVRFRKIFTRFFPRKYIVPVDAPQEWDLLNSDEKKQLALRSIAQGELALLQGNLAALALFETASQLEPENPQIWYRQGLAFFEYGSESGKERSLLLASKYFKHATQLAPEFFDAWVAWGNTLLQLGKFHGEHHFHVEAKEKYQKALELTHNQSSDTIAELYWDYGIVWTEIALHSGEALDLRLAIDAFQKTLQHQSKQPPEFFCDCGKAHLEMGLLINDALYFSQAVDLLSQSVQISPSYFDGWNLLGEVYAQLYLSTLDEKYIQKASNSYAQAVKLSGKDADTWLNWAQILGEAGRLRSDIHLLRQSVEHCARGFILDNKIRLIIAQWVESLSYLGIAVGRLDLLTEAEQKVIKFADVYPDDPDLWHAYSVVLLCFGKYYEDADYYELAIEKLQYGLSMDRTSAEHWHTLGYIHKLYADLTDHEDLLERANRFFARAIDLKPACPSIIFDAACSLFHFSELMRDLPSLQKAIGHLESLLHTHKEILLYQPQWLVTYGKALEWLFEFSLEDAHLHHAIEVFTHVLLIDPDFEGVHLHIAHCNMALGNHTDEAEFYKKAISFFRLAARQDEENEQIWLDWGVCLIHLAEHSMNSNLAQQLYWDAEQKISKAGRLGCPNAHYQLACLYSVIGRTDDAMTLIRTALSARTLPPIEELLEDDFLENLRHTESFAQFISELEAKLQAREE